MLIVFVWLQDEVSGVANDYTGSGDESGGAGPPRKRAAKSKPRKSRMSRDQSGTADADQEMPGNTYTV